MERRKSPGIYEEDRGITRESDGGLLYANPGSLLLVLYRGALGF